MPAADDHARRDRRRHRDPRRGTLDRRRARRLTSDVDLVVFAYVAGQEVSIDDANRNAAIRRALFVFAAGGDLHREPTLEDPAVLELAHDLDSPERREVLTAAVERLDTDPDTLERLRDPNLAWRAFACSLLAEALGEDEES